MDENEKQVSVQFRDVLNATPKKWNANFWTGEQIQALAKKCGLFETSLLEEKHTIHPLLVAVKRE